MVRALVVVALLAIEACGRLGYDSAANTGGDGDASPPVDAPGDAPPPPPCAVAVQSGQTDIDATNLTAIEIEPVDPACSFVVCSMRTATSAPGARVTCSLDAGGGLTFETGVATTGTVAWQVVSHPDAVVQAGTADLGGLENQLPVDIAAVDPARSFVLINSAAPTSATDDDERVVIAAELTAADQLLLSRDDNGNLGVRARWQVVELASATVQRGREILGMGTTSVDLAINPVAAGRGFVIASIELNTDIDGEEAAYRVMPTLADAQTLRLSRFAAPAPVTALWQVVELAAGSGAVEAVTGSTVAPHDQLRFATATALDSTGSFALAYAAIDAGVSRTAMGASALTARIDGADLAVERSAEVGAQLDYSAFVVQLD